MIRATELAGRAVVDVDAAEKLGRVERVVLDPDGRRVAGFVVGKGAGIFSNDKGMLLSAAAVHAVGPDAITVHRTSATETDEDALGDLPRVSDLVGRKVVSDQGRLLGTVDDVLIDETDGAIVGYTLGEHGLDEKLKDLVTGKENHDRRVPYLRADADLRAGKDLIVAPESAVSTDWAVLDTPEAPVVAPRKWRASTTTASSPDWIRSDAATPPIRTGSNL